MNLRDKNRHSWYLCFDPVGTLSNVHFLIVNKEEHVAARGAQVLAQVMGQGTVTMKRITDETGKPRHRTVPKNKRPTR